MRQKSAKVFVEQSTSGIWSFPRLRQNGVPHGFSSNKSGDMRDKAKIQSFYDQLGIASEKITTLHLIHGSEIVPISDQSPQTVTADGALMQTRGKGVAMTVGDCYVVAAHHPQSGAFLVAHVGLRGANLELPKKIVQELRKLSVGPAELDFYLGPGICQDCYTYNEAIFQKVSQQFAQFIQPVSTGEFAINLSGYIKFQLKECGVDPEKIYSAEICTCHDDIFPSHKRNLQERAAVDARIVFAAQIL